MLALEFGDQGRHGKEVVAADVENELGIGDIAVEVRQIVDFRDGEFQAAVQGVVVLAVLPRRKNVARSGWRGQGLQRQCSEKNAGEGNRAPRYQPHDGQPI